MHGGLFPRPQKVISCGEKKQKMNLHIYINEYGPIF